MSNKYNIPTTEVFLAAQELRLQKEREEAKLKDLAALAEAARRRLAITAEFEEYCAKFVDSCLPSIIEAMGSGLEFIDISQENLRALGYIYSIGYEEYLVEKFNDILVPAGYELWIPENYSEDRTLMEARTLMWEVIC